MSVDFIRNFPSQNRGGGEDGGHFNRGSAAGARRRSRCLSRRPASAATRPLAARPRRTDGARMGAARGCVSLSVGEEVRFRGTPQQNKALAAAVLQPAP